MMCIMLAMGAMLPSCQSVLAGIASKLALRNASALESAGSGRMVRILRDGAYFYIGRDGGRWPWLVIYLNPRNWRLIPKITRKHGVLRVLDWGPFFLTLGEYK